MESTGMETAEEYKARMAEKYETCDCGCAFTSHGYLRMIDPATISTYRHYDMACHSCSRKKKPCLNYFPKEKVKRERKRAKSKN
jgi:hypothetical protein